MTYAAALAALADPTRRTILERLREGPASVGAIAAGLAVSRPAVSQHLAALKRAGLVNDRADGTKRIYAIDPAGLEELRAYVDRMWDDALQSFKHAAEKERSRMTAALEPVRRSVHVAVPVERAFAVFTERISEWWPLAEPLARGRGARTVRRPSGAPIEPRAGGRVVERRGDGTEDSWGTVADLGPAAPARHRLAAQRHATPSPRSSRSASPPDGDGTLVELVHDRMGAAGAGTRPRGAREL